MKTLLLIRTLMTAGLILLTAACGNRDADKKIAALESRIAELEGKKGDAGATPAGLQPAEEKPEGPLPVIQYEETDYDFGTINEGDVVEHTFKFKNTGEAPLIIQSAKPSCGCTVPDWTKEPIPVGGEGFIHAKFDSEGKSNIQNKTITVTANTWPKESVVRFTAMVVAKK